MRPVCWFQSFSPPQFTGSGLDLFSGGFAAVVTRPVKPFTTVMQQAALLRSHGMQLDDGHARQWLTAVGYYRLSGYWYVYRDFNADGVTRSDSFLPGTCLSDVVALYEFDRKLRTLVHDGIERVEVAVRAALAAHLGALGPESYKDAVNFRPSFDHATWLAVVFKRISRAAKHHPPIRHHSQNYTGVPVWVLVDILDFADISIMYDGLPATAQWQIAQELGVDVDDSLLSGNQRSKTRKNPPLARWLQQLTILRNTAAHHSRLWNKSFTPASTAALRTIPSLASLPAGQSENLYGALLLISQVLRMVSPGSGWAGKVRALVEGCLETLPRRSAAEMGFPSSWRSALGVAPNAPVSLAPPA